MSKLDEQLKELQSRKLKVEFFKLLKTTIGDVSPKDGMKDIEKEVKDQLFAFIDAQVDMIESGEVKSNGEINTLFEDTEVQILKKMVEKVSQKQIDPYKTTGVNETLKTNGVEQTQPVNAMDKQDKIQFALKHRNLGGKDVKVKSLGNASGTVTGIDAPNIVVQLANGQYVQVPPQDIIL